MNLFISKTLVVLKINGRILLDAPRQVRLPLLKVLHLKDVRYFDRQNPLKRMLSNCPVLEDLLIKILEENNLDGFIAVSVGTLQRLTIKLPEICNIFGFQIDTPSLKFLKMKDRFYAEHTYTATPMPNLMEADIDIQRPEMINNLFRSIQSVRRLRIIVEGSYLIQDFVFNNLEHLTTTKYRRDDVTFLLQLLNDSPNLRELVTYSPNGTYFYPLWVKPPAVPTCVLSSLTTLETSIVYADIPSHETVFVLYILENARMLQTAKIWVDERFFTERNKIQLEVAPKASKECKIVYCYRP